MFSDIIDNQKTIYKRLKNMPTMEQFAAAFTEMEAETTRIGVYIEGILAQLNRTDLTEVQEQIQLDALQAAANRLKGVGKTVEEPIPTEPLPEPVPAPERNRR